MTEFTILLQIRLKNFLVFANSIRVLYDCVISELRSLDAYILVMCLMRLLSRVKLVQVIRVWKREAFRQRMTKRTIAAFDFRWVTTYIVQAFMVSTMSLFLHTEMNFWADASCLDLVSVLKSSSWA